MVKKKLKKKKASLHSSDDDDHEMKEVRVEVSPPAQAASAPAPTTSSSSPTANNNNNNNNDTNDGGAKGMAFSRRWALRRRVQLDPEAPGYSCFKPNMHPPRAEAWGFGGDLLHYGYIAINNYLWDLKEVAFFSAAITAWLVERFEGTAIQEHDKSNGTSQSDRFYLTVGFVCIFLICLVTSFIYAEFEKRKRCYYTYLLVDVFIDFENTEYHKYWRFRLCFVLGLIVLWAGFDEKELISWHNADGLITLYGLLYFVSDQVDVEKRLVPFSRIFEREDGRELICKGWKELTLVSEECFVAYALLRAQQCREALRALRKRRKELKMKENPATVFPTWHVSREDIVNFVLNEFVSKHDAELSTSTTSPPDSPESTASKHHRKQPQRKPAAPARDMSTPTASKISGFWWRQSYYGTVVGWLVIGKSCVLGPYELKDKQGKYFHNLLENNKVNGDDIVRKELRKVPLWSTMQLPELEGTSKQFQKYKRVRAKKQSSLKIIPDDGGDGGGGGRGGDGDEHKVTNQVGDNASFCHVM